MNKGSKTNARNNSNGGLRTEVAQSDKEAGTPGCHRVKRRNKLFLSNSKLARSTWGLLPSVALKSLRRLTESHGLSVAVGDLQFLDCRWYVTHSGLLRIAQRRDCAGIRTYLLKDFSDASLSHWVFKAIVYKTAESRGFVGYGDADPSNVSSLVRGAEMRVAETRAVNRALRKAYGIGLCSVEELGLVLESGEDLPPFHRPQMVSFLQRFEQRPAPAPRPTLPSDPSAQPRSDSREGLRG